jgi:hypothetical protein
MSRHLREWTWEVGDTTFTTVASSMDEAFDRAAMHAASLGLHDEPLRCVDEQAYDPTGGDADDD